jgi:hypothetical protein
MAAEMFLMVEPRKQVLAISGRIPTTLPMRYLKKLTLVACNHVNNTNDVLFLLP